MSEAGDPASPGWLIVLPPDVPEPSLERIRAEAKERGWHADASRGEEQAVLALQGPRTAAELGTLVAGLAPDVLPVLPGEHYRRQRTRRRLLSALVSGLGFLIAAGIVLPLVAFLRPPPDPIVTPDLVRVAAADEIATGKAKLARYHDQPILVIRVASAGWQAVTATCTHPSECLLEWDEPRQLVVCPCHGCRFDAQGNVLHAPASTPLLRLSAFEQHGSLFVRSLL
jgi:Rieske Fe-S protein